MENLKDTVEFKLPAYEKAAIIWRRIADAVEGQDAIKAKGETYLPHPSPEEGRLRYEGYLKRAVYYNVSGTTLRSLTGAAFAKAPVTKLPTPLKPLADDINSGGLNINQHSKKALANVTSKGRYCLYVDYPHSNKRPSKKDVEQQNIKARVIGIDPEHVINWRTERIEGVTKLSLVVISEQAEEIGDNGFSVEHSQQYRVLRLLEGKYVIEVWKKEQSGKFEKYRTYYPKTSSGKAWTEIPFVFIGSQNNDPDIDSAPFLDLVNLNIAHYRNSADYEDSCFVTGQAQLVVSGLTEPETDENGDVKHLTLGANAPLVLNESGKAYYIQPTPNGIVYEAMQDKKTDMVSLGARLVKPGEAVKTATEAQADNETEHSVLSLCVTNVNAAYVQCIKWCAEFMGAKGAIEYAINTDYSYTNLNAQLIAALTALFNTHMIPDSDAFTLLKKLELIDPAKTDDQIKDELNNSDQGLGVE